MQVSGLSHCVEAGLPHAVPDGWKPLSLQTPVRQVSWILHSVPAPPQRVPSAALLAWHAPEPLQVSGAVQVVDEASPHAVPEGWKASAGQAPDVPVQVSATSHWPAELPQVKLDVWKTSTHELLVPVQ